MRTFASYGIELPAGATGEAVTTCPWCSSQRKKKRAKCLSVNVDKGVWVCHHCGVVGGLGRGNEHFRSLHWQKPPYRRPEPKVQSDLPAAALRWFFDRGISIKVLNRNKIDYGVAYMPQVEDHVPVVIFPYFRNAELVNRKYRTLQEKNFRLTPGCELVLYGIDDVDLERVTWVEGEVDKLSVETAGVRSVVSVPNGAPAPGTKDYAGQFTFLDADWEKIAAIKRHVIAVDADAAGSRLEAELVRRLGIEKCERVRWPDGKKDANEVLVADGADGLLWYLEHPEPYPIEGVVEADDCYDDVMALYRNGFETGVSTGWPHMDETYRVRPGLLTVVSGIPASGKSNWLDCVLVNIARSCEWRFAMFSPENLPVSQHMAMIAEKWARKPFHSGQTPRMTPAEVEGAMRWIGEHFSWILPNDESHWEVDNILKIAGQLCLRYGIQGLVIDPWNELESLRPKAMSETEYISHSLKRIRVFARQRNIHVWVVVHPQKLYRDSEGKYPVPTLYDCSGSAHWRNKADNGIVVWRDMSQCDSAEVQIHVQKIRFRQDGRRGVTKLYYESVCATYAEDFNERSWT